MEHRVSQSQLEELLDYLATHTALAKGVGLGARSKVTIDREWNDLANKLNAHGSGASKSGQRWKRYWADIKHKTKTRAASRRQDATGTGGGPSTQEVISETDQKILGIIGVGAVYGDTEHRVPVFENQSDPLTMSPDITISENVIIEMTESEQNDTIGGGSGEVILISPSKNGQTSQKCPASPTKQSRPRLKRTLFHDQPTKSNKKSDQTKVDSSWVVELEQRRIAAEEKLANAAIIMAEASRIIAECAHTNADCNRMHCDIMLKLIDTLEK